MFFEKDSFFRALKTIKINNHHHLPKLPPVGTVLPICLSQSKINHLGNTVNYIIEHSKRKFILKAIDKKDNSPNKLIDILQSLYGFLKIPQPVKFLNGNYIYEDEDFYWVQLEFIEGRFYLGAITDFLKIINLLEKLFKNRDEISIALQKNVNFKKNLFVDVENEFIKYTNKFCQNKYHKLLPLSSQKLILSDHLRIIKKNFSLGQQIPCHVDLHPQNMVFDLEDNIYILDNEAFLHFPIKVALSFAIFKNFRHMVAAQNGLSDIFIEYFASSVSKVFQNQYEVLEILKIAQIEYMRRANNVFFEIETFGNSKWIENLLVQLAGVCETFQVYQELKD